MIKDRQEERTAQDDALHRAPSELPPARLPLEHRPDLIWEAKKLKAEGASWKEIARRFTAKGIPTPTGKDKWFDKTVTRMIASGDR